MRPLLRSWAGRLRLSSLGPDPVGRYFAASTHPSTRKAVPSILPTLRLLRRRPLQTTMPGKGRMLKHELGLTD